MKNNKNIWIYGTVVVLMLFFIVIPVLYKIEEINSLASQFYGALTGVAITAIITVFLLQGQTSNEEIKEQNVRVFEKKTVVFNDFIDRLWLIWRNKSISMEEIVEIIGRVSKDIIPYTKPAIAKEILGCLNKIADSIDKEDIFEKTDENVFNIINVLSKEIGLGGELNAEVRQQIVSLESKVMPFFNKQENIKKISKKILKQTMGNIHSVLEDSNVLWWKVGEDTGIWLRIGQWGKNIYLAFWSDYSHTKYQPYRYKIKGAEKDFLRIYSELQTLTQSEFEDFLQGGKISDDKLVGLVQEIVNFYNESSLTDNREKTIQEIINETKK